MSDNKKPTRLFSQVFDDIIRSPDITSNDLRLFMIMVSYCRKTKSNEPRICRLTKQCLAGIMKVSERTIFNSTRSLERAGLISIQPVGNDHRYPVYIINETPPIMSPEELLSNRLLDAKTYVETSGGVKTLQRRPYRPRQAVRRTGRPETYTGGFTLETPADEGETHVSDDPRDDGATQLAANVRLPDSSTGSGLPVILGGEPPSTGNPLPVLGGVVLATSCHRTGNQLPVVLATSCHRTGNPLLPGTDELLEKSLDIPYGMDGPRHKSALGVPPRTRGATATATSDQEQMSVRRAAPESVRRAASEKETDVARPSKAQEEERRARLERVRGKGTPRTGIKDVVTSRSPVGGSAGGDKGISPDTSKIYEEATPDPETVDEVPKNPWQVFTHFRRVVLTRFPSAGLAKAPDGKYMKWGSELLKRYDRKQLYEMIQVLVDDYENIERSKMFFKWAGGPHPNYEQFYCNADRLAQLIGVGIISPPSVRYSAYADNYAKRHGKASAVVDGEGKTTSGDDDDDPFAAVRAQING